MAGGLERERIPLERAGPQQGSPTNAPLAPFLQERQSGGERSHAELVAAFRTAVRHKQREWQERGEDVSPAQIIDFELFQQAQFRYIRQEGEYAHYKQLGEFYFPILKAWNVIAFDHYGKESEKSVAGYKNAAGSNLSEHYKQTGHTTVRLSEPQMQILDALAEAADIPHQKEQTEINIPEKLRNSEDQSK